MSKDNVIVGIATHAHSVVDFDAHFNHCWVFQEWSRKHVVKMIGYKGLAAAQARELMCDATIKNGCSHVFFLDADHIVPRETLDYLIESKDEAMISGLVIRRFYPFGQVAWGKDDKSGAYIPIELPLDGRIYEVGACAFGCTLINLEKLQKLEKPWFRDTCDVMVDKNHHNVRSDINLCDMFRANGEKVWVDTRVLVGHIGTNFLIYPQNAVDMHEFRHQYSESFKLREGQTGKYAIVPRLL